MVEKQTDGKATTEVKDVIFARAHGEKILSFGRFSEFSASSF
jgi:hypothetical protein